MTRFEVHVVDAHGRLSRRNVQADSIDEAKRSAARDGQTVILVQAASRFALPTFRQSSFDIRLFAHELVTLLQAGLSLVEALETLQSRNTGRASGEAQDTRDAPNNDVLSQLLTGLRNGESLSGVMERLSEVFPVLLSATIAASEQTGDLARGIARYLKHDEQTTMLRNKIVSASLYPAMLLIVGAAVALFLLVYLVPRFSGVYDNLDTELPLASRLLMEWGRFAGEHIGVVLTIFVALIGTGIFFLAQQNMRNSISLRLERMRWIGERLRLMRLSRFYRSLGLLIEGGIPVVKALRITARLLPEATRARVEAVILSVERGLPLSDCLEQSALSTPVASRLIRAGERNGQLADMLERTAAFHDEEIARWIDAVMKLFEPMLMIVIGLIIGMIVVLLYLPIFELAGSLQ